MLTESLSIRRLCTCTQATVWAEPRCGSVQKGTNSKELLSLEFSEATKMLSLTVYFIWVNRNVSYKSSGKKIQIPHVFKKGNTNTITKKVSEGLAPRQSSLSLHLLCQYPEWVPVWFLNALLLTQLPLMCLGKQTMIAQILWLLNPLGRPGKALGSWLQIPLPPAIAAI